MSAKAMNGLYEKKKKSIYLSKVTSTTGEMSEVMGKNVAAESWGF